MWNAESGRTQTNTIVLDPSSEVEILEQPQLMTNIRQPKQEQAPNDTIDLTQLSPPHPYGLQHPPVIRSLIRRFSPPFKPFGSIEPDTDDESLRLLDSPLIMSPQPSAIQPLPQHPHSSNPSNRDIQIVSSSETTPSTSHPIRRDGQLSHKTEQISFSSHSPLLSQTFFERNTTQSNHQPDSDIEMQDSRDHKTAKRLSHHAKSSRSLSKHSTVNPTHPTLHRSPHQKRPAPGSSDQDSEEDLQSKANVHNSLVGAGRAATARRALLPGPRTNNGVIPSPDEEPSIQPVASSSTARIILPRLRTVRRTSPDGDAHDSSNRFEASTASESSDGDAPQPEKRQIIKLKKINRSKPAVDPSAPTKSSRTKRTKTPSTPTLTTLTLPADGFGDTVDGGSPKPDKDDAQVKRRIATLMPATQPDEYGQYESSTCHQCRVKTTRPKMICDQSQDPNCVVRVCHTCLMIRTVYDDLPDLRPPLFEFVPGGTMLCVKCRDICPCASCRRRRGEKEQCRRGLGSGLKGFYGLTPEEREQALARKKEKQEANARQRKEVKTTEKKTPLVCRREVSSIRHAYEDDESERLQNWAPLPVFPPLPKRRRKKRKRLEMLDGVGFECKMSDSDSDSSCSDTDTNEDTESDSRSPSSSSSFRSHSRTRPDLEAGSFQLPLSSHHRRIIPFLTKRWRSANVPSRLQKGVSTNFSNHLYQAVNNKHKSDKAPVVWIKSGAIVQARKPPTTEFMKKLAEEQKVRSSRESTVVGPDDHHPPPPEAPSPALKYIPGQIANLALLETVLESLDSNEALNLDRVGASVPGSPPMMTPLSDLLDLHPITSNPGSRSLKTFTPTIESGECHVPKGTEGSSQEISDRAIKNGLFGSGGQADEGLNSNQGDESVSTGPGSNGIPSQVLSHNEDFGGSMRMTSYPATATEVGSPHRPSQDNFAAGSSSPVDHQTYLAGLTNEELSAVLKQGNYVMAKRGFLPSTMTERAQTMKFHNEHLNTGISPELISAALPAAGVGCGSNGQQKAEREGDGLTETQTEMDQLTGGEVEGRTVMEGINETNEEEEHSKMIEAVNWAAVWGVTDGVGGFNLANGESTPGIDGEQRRTSMSVGSSNWNNPLFTSSSGKEYLLRAMKSSVGDEWLTDVMPLDSY